MFGDAAKPPGFSCGVLRGCEGVLWRWFCHGGFPSVLAFGSPCLVEQVADVGRGRVDAWSSGAVALLAVGRRRSDAGERLQLGGVR